MPFQYAAHQPGGPDAGQRVPALLAGRVSQKSQAARDRAERAREMLRNALAEQAEADAGS
jgi:hypothetical protein